MDRLLPESSAPIGKVATYWVEALDVYEGMNPDDARVRARAAGVRVLDTSRGLLFRTAFPTSSSDHATGDRQAELIDRVVLGTRAAIPVPDVLRSLEVVRTDTVGHNLKSSPGTAANIIEASYLVATGDARPDERALVELYLQGISMVQEDDSVEPDSVEATLKFLIENWDAGDQGCTALYCEHRDAAQCPEDWVLMSLGDGA
ncbi:MAG: hypothetical protein ACPG4T_16945 [Nannocystaceae bacterium]